MDKIKKLLEETVEKISNDSIEFLQKLISYDTCIKNQGEKGNEGNAQPTIIKKLKDLGCSVDVFEPDNSKISSYKSEYNKGRHYEGRPNVVGKLKGKGGGKSIILNGHIDTVPYDEKEWKYPPLGGIIDGNRLYGRGADDMKAGLAASIYALETIIKSGINLKGDVIIESVVDEEGGGNGTLACVDRGYLADGAIITEGTNLKIIVANRGVLNVEVTVKGLASHACYKWKGINAIEKMIKIINALSELEKKWLVSKKHALLPSPTITIGQIIGGIGATIVPDKCSIKCDVKMLPSDYDQCDFAESFKKEFEEWVSMASCGDEWLSHNKPNINWYSEVMPYELDSNHHFVNTMKEALIPFLGEIEIGGMPGGSDARILHNIGKIPTILFGPGGGTAHSADEYVEVDAYIKAIKAISLMVVEFCS